MMREIHVLDSETIDKIAAGEVVERPSSVVKELVENAIDAGASAITVEGKEGGIEFLRVTDNGCGMEASQLRTAFLRHATSKISSSEDLTRIASLGFRGEALSSIAAVSKVEIITKTSEGITGSRMVLEGAGEVCMEEVGAPEGTTFIMRNLFFNTPVRRKFLKTASTEGSYIVDLMEHLALSRPDISFKLLLGNQLKFHTSGNGDLREVIYRIYGREVAGNLIPIQEERDGIRLEGYLGKPLQVRSNRNYEIYFMNGRYIKSSIIARALEEGYKEYLMQHKFPVCFLHIIMDASLVDVNVHPTKMDVRFSNPKAFSEFLYEAVWGCLKRQEMIPEASLDTDREIRERLKQEQAEHLRRKTPEPFETRRTDSYRVEEEKHYQGTERKMGEMLCSPVWSRVKASKPAVEQKSVPEEAQPKGARQEEAEDAFFVETSELQSPVTGAVEPGTTPPEGSSRQLNLFEEKLLTPQNRSRFRMVGQVFETYWLVEFDKKLLMIDQHAAHEKVHYERLMKQFHEKQVATQGLLPPIIVSLTGKEEQMLFEHRSIFEMLGFEIESFGGSEYALRSVPVDLYGCNERQMFLEVLDSLVEGTGFGALKVVEEKIASMSCKAAVKGNSLLKPAEAERLIDELLSLDNPYNCPHGRPTMVVMSKEEMEKKFKRIV